MSSRQGGFTLVEAIIAIVLLGIIGAGIGLFIRAPLQGYFDTARRADMVDAMSNAAQRIRRDLRAALPNSLHIPDSSTACLQFIPVSGGGRYRAGPKADGSGDTLSFGVYDTSFEAVLSDGLTAASAGQHVVIYNLGIPGADAYDGTNRRQISGYDPTTRLVSLTSVTEFPLESPSQRFQVAEDRSIIYSCTSGKLWRSVGSLSRISSCPTSGHEMLGTSTECGFDYVSAHAESNGLVVMRLSHSREGETLQLHQQIHDSNVP